MENDNEGITNLKHISSLPIPIEKEKVYKAIYTISSVSENNRNGSRTWCFYETLEEAIEVGLYSWSGAESFYESGYYDYIVIEKNPINHPMPMAWFLDDKDFQTWFKFIPEECNKPIEDIRKSIVRMDGPPESRKHVCGYI